MTPERWFFRRFWLPFYRRWALWYVRRERVIRMAGMRLSVPPEVFHPGVYFSTRVFIAFLKTLDLRRKRALDVGTGSGALALFAARNGAVVDALDINPAALEATRRNAAANGLQVQCWQSDLFSALPRQQYDHLLINPPYYPLTPRNAAERAFFAGEQLEYFQRLFAEMPDFLNPAGRAWMILSEDCDLEKIRELAGQNRCGFTLVFEQKKWGERLSVFEIAAIAPPSHPA